MPAIASLAPPIASRTLRSRYSVSARLSRLPLTASRKRSAATRASRTSSSRFSSSYSRAPRSVTSLAMARVAARSDAFRFSAKLSPSAPPAPAPPSSSPVAMASWHARTALRRAGGWGGEVVREARCG